MSVVRLGEYALQIIHQFTIALHILRFAIAFTDSSIYIIIFQ